MKKYHSSCADSTICVAVFAILVGCTDVNKKPILASGEYAVFAWNDLGMHCLNPEYTTAVILPPYNTVWAEVVKRGDPPQVVTEGLTVSYKLKNNTSSADKREYGTFWDNVEALFGVALEVDTGLNLKTPDTHNGLSGDMAVYDNHFEAVGMPVVPVDDDDKWNPYQVMVVTVKDKDGNVVAETEATVPTSDEITCSKCHGDSPFEDILSIHDEENETTLASSTPILCASCHGSPALGQTDAGESGLFLSQAIHGFHAEKDAKCYDCHPGKKTNCSRSLAHTNDEGNCTECHGEMRTIAESIEESGRVPWASEPKCSSCHEDVGQVDTGDTLYRNAMGHGGLACPTCHGSPHAQVPSREESDNYQSKQYQTASLPIGSCRVCHDSPHGGGNDFGDKHTGSHPEEKTACNICHTAAHDSKSDWPHQFTF
jgi:hypothetical protein